MLPQLYFERQGSLTPMYYWFGVHRPNGSSPYEFVDGSEVLQHPSNEPYAHWNWYQPMASAHEQYSCAMAYNAYR